MEPYDFRAVTRLFFALTFALTLVCCSSDGPDPIVDEGEVDDDPVEIELVWPQALVPNQSPIVAQLRLDQLDSFVGPEGRFPPFQYWEELGWRLRPGDSRDVVEFLEVIGVDLSGLAVFAAYGVEQSGIAATADWVHWVVTGEQPPDGADPLLSGSWGRYQSRPDFLTDTVMGWRLLLPITDEQSILWLLDDSTLGMQALDVPDGSGISRLLEVDSETTAVVRFAQGYVAIDFLTPSDSATNPLDVLAPLEDSESATIVTLPDGQVSFSMSVVGEHLRQMKLVNDLSAILRTQDAAVDGTRYSQDFNTTCAGLLAYDEMAWPRERAIADWVLRIDEEQTSLRMVPGSDVEPVETSGSMRAVQTPGWTGLQWPAQIVAGTGEQWQALGYAPAQFDSAHWPDFHSSVVRLEVLVTPFLAMRYLAGYTAELPETIRMAASSDDVESVVYAFGQQDTPPEIGFFLRAGADRDVTAGVLGCLRNDAVPPDCGSLRFREEMAVELARGVPDAQLAGWRYRVDTIGGRTVIWLRDSEDPIDHGFARLAIRPDPALISVLNVDLSPLTSDEETDHAAHWLAESLSGLSGRDRFSVDLSIQDDEIVWTLAYERGQRSRWSWDVPDSIYSVDTGRPTPGPVPGPCEQYVSYDEDGVIDHVVVFSYDRLGRLVDERIETPDDREVESHRVFHYASLDRPDERPSAVYSDDDNDGEWDEIENFRLDWSGRWEYSVVEERTPVIVRFEHNDDLESGLRTTVRYLVDRYGWESRLFATADLIEDTLPVADEPFRTVEAQYDTYGYGYNNASGRFRFDSSGNLVEETRFRFYRRDELTLEEIHRFTYTCWEFDGDGNLIEDNLSVAEENGFQDLSEYLPEPEPRPVDEPESQPQP